jgi:hypothetical protein
MSPPTERDLTLTSSLLPALAPQPRGGASNGSPERSAAAHSTPRLPASPHRVDSLRLAGEPPASSMLLANVVCNVAPTWAATCVGSSNSSPSIFDFMSLYDNCVTTGLAARISVIQITGYQDVTLFYRFLI